MSSWRGAFRAPFSPSRLIQLLHIQPGSSTYVTPPSLTQEDVSKIAREKGRSKVRKAWRNAREAGGEARTHTGNAAVRQIVDGLMDLLADDLEKLADGQPAAHGKALKRLKGAPIDAMCLAVARAAVNGMTAEWVPGISLQVRLGAAAEDAILEGMWRKLDPYQAEAVRARIGHSTDPLKRRLARKAYIAGWANELLTHGEGWAERTTKNVGLLFQKYLVRLGMIEHHRVLAGSGRRKWTNAMRLTEQASHWISNAYEFDAASAEVFYPSIDLPIPWAAPFGGGFHGRGEIDHPAIPRNQRPFWIVKNARKEHKALLLKADLSTVFAALNVAQGTGWRINRRVFDVFEELRRYGKGEGGLALADKAEKPERPPQADDDEAVNKKFLAERRDYYAGERKMAAKRRAEYHTFDCARLFKDSERFYFIHALDFRGRAYVCSEFLSPQGRDLERGVLEFAEGDVMTAEGERWLKIHLANTFGHDKESFTDRVRWAEENSGRFCQIAADPIERVRDWERADSPWQFLAACFAWADYKAGEPLCHLPVTVDGSCSGIQHSAALVADEDAGERVNLVPRGAHEKPADIYSDVAARANEILAKKAKALDQRAYRWRYEWIVTRADTKPSVMTLPYGAAKFANLGKVRKAVEKQIAKGSKQRPTWLSFDKDNREERSAAFAVLSDAIWQAMEEIIRAPMAVMRYFKDCTRALREREKQLQREALKVSRRNADSPHLRFAWTSPCGFPVLCDYRVSKERRTQLKDPETGRRQTFKYYEATMATDWREVAQTAPPNFIHSLDASHLLRVLARCPTAGVTQVAIVHDAFATTPSKMPALVELLGDEFVEMYSRDVLGETLGRMLDEIGAEQPAGIHRGSLDVEAAKRSIYLFA